MPHVRFSLLTALLLTTIAAMAIVIALLWREVGPLRAQVKSMRTELGMLNIDDPTRVHVIQIGTSEEHHNKWRIYLPPGGSYSLSAYGGSIPPDPNGQAQQAWFTSVKQNGSGMTDSLDSGEFVLETWLVKEGDRWLLKMSKANGVSFGGISLDPAFNDWLSQPMGQSVRSGAGFTQQAVLYPGESFLLMKTVKPIITRAAGATTVSTPTVAAGGVVVWIDQQPPPSSNSTAKP